MPIVIAITDWRLVDPLLGAAIGLMILPRAVRLGRDALRVLLQARRRDSTSTRVQTDLAAIDGVVDVHDLHVWTLTSEMEVASAHLMVTKRRTRTPCSTRRERCSSIGTTCATRRCRSSPRITPGCEEVNW